MALEPMEEPDRLDSWKQIAAYLGKSERTVRRWQETEGLPVHRHLHQQRGSVWAFRSEIDAWLESRGLPPETPGDGPAPKPPPRFTPSPAVFTAVGILLAGLAGVLWYFTGHPPPAVHEPVQITSLPGSVAAPAFSPDGGRLVFSWTSQGRSPGGLYIKHVGSESVSPLVTVSGPSGRFDYSPAWSPDGQTIAFVRRVTPAPGFAMYATASETWLYVIAASGGPERRILRLAKDVLYYANSAHVSWSADGQWVLAPMADGDRRGIHRISLRTGDAIRISQGTAHEFAPALAPNGRSFVFMRQEGPSAASIERVFRQDLAEDGKPVGQPRELFTGRSMSSGLAWLPSGKELIFCTAASAFYGPFNSRMYRMSAESAAPLVPLGLGVGCSTLAVSPADSSGRVDLVYGSGENARGNLYQARLNALDDVAPLAQSSRFDGLPSHSPDGSLIAFISNRTGEPELWLTRPDGTGITGLTQNSHIASIPRWSPDGNRLVYGAAERPGGGGPSHSLYVIPITGGVPMRIPVSQPWPSDPSWSPDGKFIYYWSDSQVWRASPDGAAVQVGDYPAHFVRPGIAVDGRMYFARSGKPFEIQRIALDKGDPEVIAEGLNSPFFAVTARFVYYINHSDQGLYARPINGGKARLVGRMPQPDGHRRIVLGISASPDDKTMVWAVTGVQQLDLQLVRNFR